MQPRHDLLALIAVAERPVRPHEAAAALGVDQAELLEVAEGLIAEGTLGDTADGLVPGDAPPVTAARRAVVAGRWAETLEAGGADPGEVGRALLAAGRPAEALERLLPAAGPGAEPAVLDATLEAGRRSGRLAPGDEGKVLLARAAQRRGRGESAAAADDLEQAVRRLEGPELIDALGFAAAVADDLQRPQEAETLTALATYQAAELGELAKQGSLLTLHGRSLSRIGFPEEADRSLEVGGALVAEHGTDRQAHHADLNRAWVLLDRGEVREAEPLLARLRSEARDADPVTLADREAYWARALFGIGHADAALAAVSRAEDLAADAAAPRFIAGLARVEGAWLFGRYLEGLGVADDLASLVRSELPAWENVVETWRARLLAGLGRREDAAQAVEQARAATPAGANGWRWRIRIRALELALTPDREPWPRTEAEDVTDELLRARWYEPAARLMATRAVREADPELTSQAAALALRLGNPMLAARCIEEAGGWTTDAGVATSRAVRSIVSRVPEEWRDDWEALAEVAHARSVGETESRVVYEDEVARQAEEALEAAGLAGAEVVLSPAQRQASGLVRRRGGRLRGPLGAAAAAIGVVVLSGVTALAVVAASSPEEEAVASPPTTATVESPTTTAIEDRVVPAPDDGLAGQVPYRGDAGRSGNVGDAGVVEMEGRYWTSRPGGFFATDPVAYGRLVYLGSATSDSLLAIRQADGSVAFEVETGDRVRSAPAVEQQGEVTIMVFGADDGRVYARNALRGGLSTLWERDLGAAVSGAPVMQDGVAVVATTGGEVLALEAAGSGETRWSYTGTESAPLGPVDGAVALAEGIIYVADREGWLHLIDFETGAPICATETFGRLADSPIISDGITFLPTDTGILQMLPAGACRGVATGAVAQIGTSTAFIEPPAVADGVVYALEEQRLVAYEVATGDLTAWELPFDAGERITTPPVVGGGAVYVGTQSGRVLAVDAATGEQLWAFEVGEPIQGSLAPLPGAVIATTAEGTVVAIAGE